MDAPTIGSRIAYFRAKRGLTQEEMAAKMQLRGHDSLTQPRQVEIEKDRRDVSYQELVSYARILRMPITELLGVPDDDPSTY